MPELHFKGKEYVYNHHLTVPYRPLVAHPDKSISDESENLIIHGDNLHALKALLPRYAGRVDCIYIDPPYNTGEQTWSYNDNVNSPLMQQWLKENPVNDEDMLRHDKWLCMMYSRLQILSELLKEDGAIFVSINDIEAGNLRHAMDEIFGDSSFLAQLTWKSRQNKDNRNKSGISVDHEYVFCYGKKLRGAERKTEQFTNPDNDPRGDWTSGNMVGLASKDARPNLHYSLIDPDTGTDYGCPGQGWRYEPATMQKLITEKRILWPSLPEGRPREKVFLNELEEKPNISSVVGAGLFTRDGTAELDAIFGARPFKFPKPSGLIREIILQGGSKDAVILDSFAGSATTAHAVLAQNAKDGGNRRFILVECEGYADKLTAERVRRVIKGYKFKGTHKEELLRTSITWSKFSKDKQHHKILDQVQAIENLETSRFDAIKKTIKDGELIVTGEKKVTKKIEGLGGGFTYYTLGDPLDLNKMLTGKSLPNYASIGAWLFHTATGEPLALKSIKEKQWYLGSSAAFHVWLVYKPELDFLKSRDAALTLSLAEKIAKKKGKRHLVFAPSRFVPNKMLLPLGVEYAPLPFALYRFEKD